MDKTKIMIVDDETWILDVLTTFLSKDYEVITAENGLEAMEKYLIEHPMVIITDINMPHMSGMELLKALKEISSYTEVIVMTGYLTPEVLFEAQEAGAFDCISKPVSIFDLQGILERVMHKINLQVVC